MISLKRAKNIPLLLRILWRAVTYGPANRVPKKISRIIVVPTGKLGDVVCTTPVMSAIRSRLPQARIIMAGNPTLHKRVLDNSGLADEYISEVEMFSVKADVALLTGPSFELAAPLYIAGIPLVVAPKVEGVYSPQVTRPYRMLLLFLKTFCYKMEEYAPRERLRCLESLGIVCDDTSKHLGYSKKAEEDVLKFFADNGIDINRDFLVGLTPTAGHKIKEWPEDRFAEVIDYLVDRHHAKVLVLGGPNDKDKVRDTLERVKSRDSVIETTHFSLDELKAAISKLRLFVSVDTGPIYVAEAFGIPTIDITGPIDEREQPPQGPLHKNVVPKDRERPQLFVLNAKTYNRDEASRQLMSITPRMVKDVIDLLIEDIKKGG